VIHGGIAAMSAPEDDPELQRRARRTVALLYVLTFVLIALPLVLWWFFGR
jgi:hypothetical protein